MTKRSEGGWKNSRWRRGQEKVYNREEWKKLLRTARNCHVLHMPMEYYFICQLTPLLHSDSSA
jgi:hypothetical protein